MGRTNLHRDPWLRGIGHRFQEGLLGKLYIDHDYTKNGVNKLIFSAGGISSRPTGAGKRLILIDVGSKDGFLGPGKQFIGKKGTADYHSEMNGEHFQEWIKEVVSALPNKSVLVLDQASYHRNITPETRNPTLSYRKQDLINWLQEHNIPVPAEVNSFSVMKVAELQELAKKNRVKPQFEVERIIAEENASDPARNIKLLWLPVAHCELNPIELMWAAIKGN